MPADIEREAEELRGRFEQAAEGLTLGVTWRAASDHLAGLIASTASTVGHAEALCDAAAQDMKSAIRRNWRAEAQGA